MKEITIPLEEYKELLEIKGKYEQLKEDSKTNITWNPGIRYNGIDVMSLKEPYQVTCMEGCNED